MLGNCILRDPTTKVGQFDKGALCESLLFFESAHLLIDIGTLGRMIEAGFIDDLIALLEAKLLTANYSPQAAVLHTNNKNGIREHFFTIIKMCGDQTNPNMRNPQILERDLLRLSDDKQKARRQFRRLADLISFKDVPGGGVAEIGQRDVCDSGFMREIARIALAAKGIPQSEIRFSYIEAQPLAENKFIIATDIDFARLSRFVPEPDRPTFNQTALLPAIADARFDIGIAASRNSAFVGNERNQAVTELILRKSLGQLFDPSIAERQIYDFVSVATPTIREVVNEGERTVAEFVNLMEKADSFRNWLKVQNPNADLLTEMLREKSNSGWLDRLPTKAARFGLFTVAGMVADYFVPGSSIASGAADSFLLDKVAKRWRPHYFIENSLKGFLDI